MTPGDSHVEQVLRARAAAGEGTRLYFGYSTILDREATAAWRDQHGYDFFELPAGEPAEALDVAVVFDFGSRYWGGRVAGLADRPGARVHGRLFEVSLRDWPVIEHKEGAITRMTEARLVRVRAGGREVEAWAFATRAERRTPDGPVSEAFLEALLRGARSAGLPEAWLEELRAAAR